MHEIALSESYFLCEGGVRFFLEKFTALVLHFQIDLHRLLGECSGDLSALFKVSYFWHFRRFLGKKVFFGFFWPLISCAEKRYSECALGLLPELKFGCFTKVRRLRSHQAPF